MEKTKIYSKPMLMPVVIDAVSILMTGSMEPPWDIGNEDDPPWGLNSSGGNQQNTIFGNNNIGRTSIFDNGGTPF